MQNDTGLVLILTLADIVIFLSYMAIPSLIGYYRIKSGLPFKEFKEISLVFIAFILTCGFTHIGEVLITFYPMYRLLALLKIICAVISFYSVLKVVYFVPHGLKYHIAFINLSSKYKEAKIKIKKLELQIKELQHDNKKD